MKINFQLRFFQKKKFDERMIARYFRNALKHFKIAADSRHPEVIFKFSYDALIKTGIILIAS